MAPLAHNALSWRDLETKTPLVAEYRQGLLSLLSLHSPEQRTELTTARNTP